MMYEITDLCSSEDDDKIRTFLSYYIPEARIAHNFDEFSAEIDFYDDVLISKNEDSLLNEEWYKNDLNSFRFSPKQYVIG